MSKLNLDSEEKSGYLITGEMKKVWQVELDILEEIIKICKKYNIKYYLNGGTLLGAARHKGFIPWDDDIDLMMLRKDYDRFMEIAIKELKEPYFCQCYKNEKNYFRGHIQVRNSNTTAIIFNDKYNQYNKGIWVDIFPLDNIPDDENERKKFIKKVKFKKKIISFSINCYSPSILKKLFKLFFYKIYWKIFNVDKAIKNLEEYATKYKDVETKYSEILIMEPGEFNYHNDWFKEDDEIDFEYLKLATIKKYDEYLEELYGKNYMKIPKVKPSSMHGKTYFNVNKSYKEYSKDEILKIANDLKQE